MAMLNNQMVYIIHYKQIIKQIIAILYKQIFPIFPPSAMPRGQEDPTPLANADTEDSNEESPYVLRCLGATALTLPWKMWGNPMESLENVGKTMGNP